MMMVALDISLAAIFIVSSGVAVVMMMVLVTMAIELAAIFYRYWRRYYCDDDSTGDDFVGSPADCCFQLSSLDWNKLFFCCYVT